MEIPKTRKNIDVAANFSILLPFKMELGLLTPTVFDCETWQKSFRRQTIGNFIDKKAKADF
ncbi:MAG TPA: hypothetical protein DEF21_13545 [Thalassospira lucentensis]|uniref:Uncharacterized protein n=1 Tax=Thalassospira lucentensis TaxID=168935 RepID=A0A358HUR8_9PROT|nr:hypothetical protein [Thalassospira lucentensis]|tara:strand:+ start:1103 stop:1285 length:183 start_codon:yes stop_codon:yes gene_type:complete